MVGAWAAFVPWLNVVVVRVTPVFTAIRLAAFVVATIRLAAALSLFIATTIVAIPITLGEGKSSRGQRHRHDSGNNCFVHAGLHLGGKSHSRLAHFVVRLVVRIPLGTPIKSVLNAIEGSAPRPAKTNIQEYVSASAYYLQLFSHYAASLIAVALCWRVVTGFTASRRPVAASTAVRLLSAGLPTFDSIL